MHFARPVVRASVEIAHVDRYCSRSDGPKHRNTGRACCRSLSIRRQLSRLANDTKPLLHLWCAHQIPADAARNRADLNVSVIGAPAILTQGIAVAGKVGHGPLKPARRAAASR
jgi:hypothetical protein